MSSNPEMLGYQPSVFDEPVNPDNSAYSLRFARQLQSDPAIEATVLSAEQSITLTPDVGIAGYAAIDEITRTRQELLAAITTNGGKDLFALVTTGVTASVGDVGPPRGLGYAEQRELKNKAIALVHINRDFDNEVIPVSPVAQNIEIRTARVEGRFTVTATPDGAITVADLGAADGIEVFTRKMKTSEEQVPLRPTEVGVARGGLWKIFGRRGRAETVARQLVHVTGHPETELNETDKWSIDPEQASLLLEAQLVLDRQ